MRPIPLSVAWFVVFSLLSSALAATADTTLHMKVDVDTTDLARHLLRSQVTIPVEPGDVELWYPKWIPGIHGPGEQIRNVGGFQVHGTDGQSIPWRRDENDLYKMHVAVPDDCRTITVELTYIANQPTRVSGGVDSYGTNRVAVVNFNTCVVYPAGASARGTTIDLRLRLPPEWKFGTSLRLMQANDGWHEFATTSLETLIDSPVIASTHYRRLDIESPGGPPVHMHFVADSPVSLSFDEAVTNPFKQLVQEAYQLFGSAPYDEYHFLVVCSDTVPGAGLEHLSSSYNVIDERDLVDEEKREGRWVYLLPHEMVHAWCGKYRRPVGMVRDDYHTTKQTKHLWIYEGLTQYLGQVLSTRSGLLDFESLLERTAAQVGYLSKRAGRNWRSLEDTAISAHTLRGGSNSWNDLRRSQDYYDEGALFWLEVDSIIREQTDGGKSLDDFCRGFFASPGGVQIVKPFEIDEVVATLESLASFNWTELIERRIYLPQDQLPTDSIFRAGYELRYVAEKPDYVKQREKEREYLSAEYSLGITLNSKNKVRSVAPGSVADQAGLASEMEVLGVNNKKFTKERFQDALSATVETGQIELLVLEADTFRSIQMSYSEGPKYPHLSPLEGRKNWLADIFAPKTRDK